MMTTCNLTKEALTGGLCTLDYPEKKSSVTIHVSGHGSGDQIKKIIEESNSKMLVPVHTEHEEYHKKWHPM
jgi:mRNA degradation ribonuclease J1/J2